MIRLSAATTKPQLPRVSRKTHAATSPTGASRRFRFETRQTLPRACQRDGYRGSSNGTAQSLAESIRRTIGGLDTQSVSEPRRRAGRTALAPHLEELFPLLSSIQNPLVSGKRRADAAGSSTPNTRSGDRDSSSWCSPPPVRAKSSIVSQIGPDRKTSRDPLDDFDWRSPKPDPSPRSFTC